MMLTAAAATTVLVAPAGAGKSHTMAEFARLWTTFTGRRVIGLTTSTNAARVLAHEGLAESYNIAEFLGKTEGSDELRRPVPLHQDDVLVLDEASQLSTADLAMISEAARQAGARVIATGDTAQLGAVEAGGMFRLLAQEVPAAQLHEVRRFDAAWEREASVRLRDGDLAAVAAYDRHGRIRGADERSRLRPRRLDVARRPPARQGRAAARRIQRRSRRAVPPRPGQAHPDRQRRPAAGPAVGRQPRRRRRPGPRPPQHRDRRRRPPAHQPRHAPGHRVPRPRRRGPAAAPGRDLDRAVPGAPGLPRRPTPSSPTPATSTSPRAAPSTPPTSSSPTSLSRQALYVGMTRGRQANTAHVVTGKTAPPGHEPYQQAAPESVLAGVMQRDDGDLSATEQIRQAQDWAGGTGHLLTLWSAAIRQTLHPDIDQQIKARLTESEAWRYDREHSRQALQQQLRAAQLAGHDISALIDQITAAPMDRARSISSVLHGRLQRLALPDLRHDATWAQRTPASAPPVAHELAAALDDRARALGERTGRQPRTLAGPPARRPRPRRVPRAARGIHPPRGHRPPPTGKPPGSPTPTRPSHPSRTAATPNSKPCARRSSPPWRSATKPTSSAAWTAASSKPESSRANAPAPPPRPTSAASCGSPRKPKPTPCQQSADAAAQHDHTGAASATALAAQLAAERQRLEAANARYEQWSADTRATRDAAGKAAAELQRRGHAQPDREPHPQPEDEPQQMAGWWQQLEADAEAVNCADASEHQAASDTGEPRPPQRVPDMNPPSASRSEPRTSPENEPEQDDRAARLDELLARADQAAQRIAAQQAERQASSEYAARMELEAQTQAEAGQQAEARDEAELEL